MNYSEVSQFKVKNNRKFKMPLSFPDGTVEYAEYTYEDIIYHFWDKWKEEAMKMTKDISYLTEEHCIDDFCKVYGAFEVIDISNDKD